MMQHCFLHSHPLQQDSQRIQNKDDEQNNIDNLFLLLQKHCPQVTVLATAKNADEGSAIILQYYPELILLDIQMPGKNGLELLKSLNNYSFEIIFVTAYDQYGIQAIKFAAIDYLLKPVNTDELKQAVQRAVQHAAQKKQNLQLEKPDSIIAAATKQGRTPHCINYFKGNKVCPYE